MKTSKEKIEEESRSRGFFRPDEVVESIVVTKVITIGYSFTQFSLPSVRNCLS